MGMRKEHLLMIACTLFLAIGQFFHKLAGTNIEPSIAGVLLNWPWYFGLIAAGIGSVLMTLALRDGELSTLFPFVSLSFVWTAFIATIVFGELFLPSTAIGIVVIVAGVVLLGRSGVVA